MPAGWLTPVFFVLILAACTASVPPSEQRAMTVAPVSFDALPGWLEDRHAAALKTFLASCAPASRRPAPPSLQQHLSADRWQAVCRAAADVAPGDAAAQAFFERWFQPHHVAGPGGAEGLFTGYFEAALKGSRHRDDRWRYPLYALPPDPAARRLDRAAIQAGALAGRAEVLAWVEDPIDAYLLQIQGSGQVLLSDGGTLRLGYAGNNGRAYASIGRILIQRGALERKCVIWPTIRRWLEDNPDKQQTLFAENPRYVFFREISGAGPIGSAGVALTPGRSLAIDPRFVALGLPIWIDAAEPGDSSPGSCGPGAPPLKRLLVAQDTGNAIRGAVRGDVFWGHGSAALERAGRMRSRGRIHLLLPRTQESASGKY